MKGKDQMLGAAENAIERAGGTLFVDGLGASMPHCRLNEFDRLVLRVRGGDIEAFNEIMCATEARVLGIAWRLLGCREQAKDACQEAYMRAFKSLKSYRTGESFPAWMGRIVANVCRDYLNKRERGAVDAQILDSIPSPGGNDAETCMLQQQHTELVQRALATLTPAERSAIVFRDMEGLSTDETARLLGIKAGTVRTQVSSARAKITSYCKRIMQKTDSHGQIRGGRA